MIFTVLYWVGIVGGGVTLLLGLITSMSNMRRPSEANAAARGALWIAALFVIFFLVGSFGAGKKPSQSEPLQFVHEASYYP